jgi:hypothetical protein
MITTTLANRFKGYGWHLPDTILFNGQGTQIGQWTTEMEAGLAEHFSQIPSIRQPQVTLTAKAYLHMNKELPQDWWDMINWCLNKTRANIHIQIIEYTKQNPGPYTQMENEKRYVGLINKLKTYSAAFKARIQISFGNEPTLANAINTWNGTLTEFRQWQADRIASVVGFSCYIGNEADLTGNLENLKFHLTKGTKFMGSSFHIYKFKANHPYHLRTLQRVVAHLCDLVSKPITTILISESSYSIERNNTTQYDLWAYHAPRHASDNGIRSNFFTCVLIHPDALTKLRTGLDDLKKSIQTVNIEMPYLEDEKIRNAQISVYLGLKQVTDTVGNPQTTPEGVAGYNEVFW